jgi:hypothetical protein
MGVKNPPLSALTSWAVVSLFVQTTMVPTATVTGFGENAVFVNVDAPKTIEIGLVIVVGGC